MFQVHDVITLRIKKASKTIRNFLNTVVTLCTLVGVLYLIYWGLAQNDEIVVNLLQNYFSPLVNVFFNDTTLMENYLKTGLYMFAIGSVGLVVNYIVQKIEEVSININQKQIEIINKRAKAKEELKKENEFNVINSYSICLSMDLASNKNLKANFKEKLYEYTTKLIKKELDKISNKVSVTNSNAIVIYSNDFLVFDKIYQAVIKQLANVKNIIGNAVQMTPTITTDAYSGNFKIQKAVRQHYEIIKCNLKGRATTTAEFRKKYTHLNQNKYAGIPIGLYTNFDSQTPHEYDLNLISKDLNKTLTTIN